MADKPHELLLDLLRTLEDLQIASTCGEWIAYRNLLAESPWRSGRMWEESPPSQSGQSDYEAATENLTKLTSEWGAFFKQLASLSIPGAPDARVINRLIANEFEDARFVGWGPIFASSDRTDDLYREGFNAITSRLNGMTSTTGPVLALLRAAIEVAAESAGLPADQPSSRKTAFSADRTRWAFAETRRANGHRWKLIAEQWRRETGDVVDDKTFEISCGRAKRAALSRRQGK